MGVSSTSLSPEWKLSGLYTLPQPCEGVQVAESCLPLFPGALELECQETACVFHIFPWSLSILGLLSIHEVCWVPLPLFFVSFPAVLTMVLPQHSERSKIKVAFLGSTLKGWGCQMHDLFTLCSDKEIMSQVDFSKYWANTGLGKGVTWVKWNCSTVPFQSGFSQFCSHLRYCNFLTGFWLPHKIYLSNVLLLLLSEGTSAESSYSIIFLTS